MELFHNLLYSSCNLSSAWHLNYSLPFGWEDKVQQLLLPPYKCVKKWVRDFWSCRTELCPAMLTLSTELKSVKTHGGVWGMLNFPVFCPCYHKVDYLLFFSSFTYTWIFSHVIKLCLYNGFVLPITHSQLSILNPPVSSFPPQLVSVFFFEIESCIYYYRMLWAAIFLLWMGSNQEMSLYPICAMLYQKKMDLSAFFPCQVGNTLW